MSANGTGASPDKVARARAVYAMIMSNALDPKVFDEMYQPTELPKGPAGAASARELDTLRAGGFTLVVDGTARSKSTTYAAAGIAAQYTTQVIAVPIVTRYFLVGSGTDVPTPARVFVFYAAQQAISLPTIVPPPVAAL